jgi:hypothetical protein
MSEPQGEFLKIDHAKSDAVMMLLLSIAQGPAEAYGIMLTCIYRLNFEFIEQPSNMDGLIQEISTSLRSMTAHKRLDS